MYLTMFVVLVCISLPCTELKILNGVPEETADQNVPPVPGSLKDRQNNIIKHHETGNAIVEDAKMSIQRYKNFAKLTKILGELKSQMDSVIKSVNSMKEAEGTKPLAKSCASLYKAGVRKDGVYRINPDDLGCGFEVMCDMTTDGGGWTVFHRRQDGSVNFYRGWEDYKNGFGDLNGEFWLGLDKIRRLTQSGQNILRVDLMDFDNATAYSKFETFSVAGETDSYRLNVGSYSGTAGDSLRKHNAMKFSTKDRDNDQWWPDNCASMRMGAWWYKRCYDSNLNGLYMETRQSTPMGINWYHWKNAYEPVKGAEMKVRPAQF